MSEAKQTGSTAIVRGQCGGCGEMSGQEPPSLPSRAEPHASSVVVGAQVHGLDLAAVSCVQCSGTVKSDADLSTFSVYPGGAIRADGSSPGKEYQELWFSIARLHWASVVLVPCDRGGSAAEVATSLAMVGTQLRATPVTAIVAKHVDYASARALAELQPRLHGAPAWPPAVEIDARPVSAASETGSREGHVPNATLMAPIGRAVIAIPSVMDEPLGVAVAQAADAVVLCIELGRTRVPSARRTIELIGGERVLGTVLVR